MTAKKNILIVSNFPDNFLFFKRMFNSLHALGYYPFLLTNKYSNYLSALNCDVEPLLIKKRKNLREHHPEAALELKDGSLKKKKAEVLFGSIYEILDELHKKYHIDIIFMWSGVRLIDKAVTHFARMRAISTLYFELGNFPSKIFVDPEGTNANSLLARKPEILEGFETNSDAFNQWKANYLEEQLKHHSVPQSRSVKQLAAKRNLTDLLGFQFLGILKNAPVFTKKKVSNKLLQSSAVSKFDIMEPEESGYFFFPMQVSDDANLLLNSRAGNREAIEYAAEEARKVNAALYVKPHPAERDPSHIEEILKLKEKIGFRFISGNTLQIMKNARKVITINSTAGLQAKLLGRKVDVLGKAFWSSFTEEDIAAYIMNYLMDIDFWGPEEITVDAMKHILERVSIGRD